MCADIVIIIPNFAVKVKNEPKKKPARAGFHWKKLFAPYFHSKCMDDMVLHFLCGIHSQIESFLVIAGIDVKDAVVVFSSVVENIERFFHASGYPDHHEFNKLHLVVVNDVFSPPNALGLDAILVDVIPLQTIQSHQDKEQKERGEQSCHHEYRLGVPVTDKTDKHKGNPKHEHAHIRYDKFDNFCL
jgi:hypothetical protein